MADAASTLDGWQIPPGWRGMLWRVLDAILRHAVHCYWCMFLTSLAIVGFAVELLGFDFPFFRPFRAVLHSLGW